MAKPIQGNQSYLETLFDVASHTLVGAGAGALASKAFYPLQMKEGAIFGAALNTFAAGVQQLVKLAGFEESFASKTIVSAATLGAAFFALSQPSAATLLGRVGLDFAKDAIMKSCAASFLAELVLGVVKAYVTSAPTAESKVAAFTAEEVKEIYAKWTEKTTKKGEEEPEIPAELHEAFFARFEKDGLYKETVDGFKKADDVKTAPDHVIVFIFRTEPVITDKAVKTAADERIAKLPAVTSKPDSKEAVEQLDPAVVRFAFQNYAVYTKDMKAETKEALDAKIIAEHAKKPENKEAAEKMSFNQLAFIYANFASYTDKMDAEIIKALETGIALSGLVVVVKPADTAAVAKLSRMEVIALHAQHDVLFKDAKFEDAEVIKALNGRYKAADAGLAFKAVPKKPDPKATEKSTAQKALETWRAYAPTWAQNHEKTIGTVVTLGTLEGLSVGFEALTGINVPFNGF